MGKWWRSAPLWGTMLLAHFLSALPAGWNAVSSGFPEENKVGQLTCAQQSAAAAGGSSPPGADANISPASGLRVSIRMRTQPQHLHSDPGSAFVAVLIYPSNPRLDSCTCFSTKRRSTQPIYHPVRAAATELIWTALKVKFLSAVVSITS